MMGCPSYEVADQGCTDQCPSGLSCCAGVCVDLMSDPTSCGVCGGACTGDASVCVEGECTPPQCDAVCDMGSCCGEHCCSEGQRCCFGSDTGLVCMNEDDGCRP
ncbi:hypothetical protein E8A73_042225 [Polyangium aurulentum]|nr:hypothetical protein E8A73_042225 [Polyangium aurulentum]